MTTKKLKKNALSYTLHNIKKSMVYVTMIMLNYKCKY